MPIVDPFDKPTKASPRAEQRQLQMEATRQDILSAPVSRAASAASVARAGVEIPRAAVALQVDQATKDASIRKALADANNAEFSAKVAALKSKYPDLTAEQTLAGARVALMEEGEGAYQQAKTFDPGSPRNLVAGALSAIPMAGSTLSTYVRDPDSQMATAGMQQFTEGATRSLTGAGLRGDERTFTQSDFYPVAGESAAIKAQKARLRKKYINQMITAAGPAYQGAGVTGGAPTAATVAPTGLPKGFKFIGQVSK